MLIPPTKAQPLPGGGGTGTLRAWRNAYWTFTRSAQYIFAKGSWNFVRLAQYIRPLAPAKTKTKNQKPANEESLRDGPSFRAPRVGTPQAPEPARPDRAKSRVAYCADLAREHRARSKKTITAKA